MVKSSKNGIVLISILNFHMLNFFVIDSLEKQYHWIKLFFRFYYWSGSEKKRRKTLRFQPETIIFMLGFQ